MKPRPLSEILRPLREQVEASGITDEELTALIEAAREEHAEDEKRKQDD